MVSRLAITALASALLAACAVGPDHVRPEMPVPATFSGSPASGTPGAAPAPAPITADVADFWVVFDDPQLTALVERALVANHNLRIALSRYDQARALLRQSRLDVLPTVTARGEGASTRASADELAGVPRADRDGEGYSAGLAASWELDLFGRVRRGIEAGRADATATADDLRATQVAVVAEVATAYLSLRGLQERLRVAEDNAGTQRDTLRLVEARFAAGQDSAFDSARARAQVASTLARVPALEAQVAATIHRLAVLTGRTPDALLGELSAVRALPAVPATIDPGTPGTLLRRRPDIAAAEQRLHAATARVGVATADLFPRFSLGALLGSQAIDSGDLFARDSETRVVALGIDWSFLDIGRVRARIAARDAEAEGELARYQQTVLLALEDTENALVRFDRARAEDRQLEEAALASARAAGLARLRFDAGATGLLDVLDAERTRLQAQDAFADSRTRSTTGAVAVYRALAGGWPQALPQREALGAAESQR